VFPEQDIFVSENIVNQPAVGGIAIAPRSAAVGLKAGSESSTTLAILVSLSVCHLLNDMNQSLVPAIYPILKQSYSLDFGQIGLITLAFQLTASLLQPVVGMVTDRRPQPFSLPVAMGCSLIGLLMLSVANSYGMVLFSAALVGIGSSVFHPESSRVARMASGGRYGFAQSLFQLGGATGSSIGPLLAAFIVVPRGQGSIAWFSAAALLAIVILANVSLWYARHPAMAARRGRRVAHVAPPSPLKRSTVIFAFSILLVLLFSKNVYTASLSSYFTFYLIDRFGISVQSAQLHLFVFLGAVAAGTFVGGPTGDLVLHPRHVPVRPGTALCEPHVDRRAERDDRADSCVRLFGDRCLCAGTYAGPGWHGRRHGVRFLVRPWWAWSGGARADRGCNQH
jgi:MFS transporter, FSR family, fosmidomycin resistance protein